MSDPDDAEKYPKDTDLNNLVRELVDRLQDGAVSVHIEDRDTHWLVTTDWGEE